MMYLAIRDNPYHAINIEKELIVGRDDSACDWVIDDAMISRRHLRIYPDEGVVGFVDLDSTHGTWVDGVRTSEGQLRPGQTIVLGQTPLIVGERPASERPESTIVPVGIVPQFRPSEELPGGPHLRREYDRLLATYEVIRAIGTENDPWLIAERLQGCVFRLLPADRSILVLTRNHRTLLESARSREGEELQTKIPRALYQRALDERAAILTADAVVDQRFSRSQSVMANEIRSSMTVPLVWKNSVHGVLQVDTQSAVNAFTEKDLELFGTIASQAAFSIHHAGLQRELKETERRTREAEAQRKSAEDASKAKSRFLAHMSHEIRTPLNAVIGVSELALGLPCDDELQEYLETIAASGTSLLRIVNDVLDFSKIEADRIEVERVEVDLPDLLAMTLPGPVAQMRTKGLEFEAEVRPDVPALIEGDPIRLQQVLINLLSNATKFTPDGHIRLLIELCGHRLCIRVVDSGIGMNPEQLEGIFSPFQQADSSTTRKFGGTGLGLSISRQLTELMGGRLWAESTEGQGSTFHVELPLRPTAPSRAKASGKVLVVSPNPTVLETVSAKVQHLGYEPISADAGEALAPVLAGAFELVGAIVDGELDATSAVGPQVRTSAPNARTLLVLPPGRSRSGESEGFDAVVSGPLFADSILGVMSDARPPEERAAKEWLSKLNVLVVDDSPVNRMVASRLLARMGHEAEEVPSGEDALRALNLRSYDVVLMDVQMPKMDGLETTRRIRELDPEKAKVPIVALTGCATKEDEGRCQEAGMNGYLAKPVSGAQLREALEELMNSRRR